MPSFLCKKNRKKMRFLRKKLLKNLRISLKYSNFTSVINQQTNKRANEIFRDERGLSEYLIQTSSNVWESASFENEEGLSEEYISERIEEWLDGIKDVFDSVGIEYEVTCE